MNLVEQIQQHKIVAVIRKADVNNIVPILNALYEGGSTQSRLLQKLQMFCK